MNAIGSLECDSLRSQPVGRHKALGHLLVTHSHPGAQTPKDVLGTSILLSLKLSLLRQSRVFGLVNTLWVTHSVTR